MNKVLVVGGTGMLTGLVYDLATDNQVYVIARSDNSLKALTDTNNIIPVVVDYTDVSELERKLTN